MIYILLLLLHQLINKNMKEITYNIWQKALLDDEFNNSCKEQMKENFFKPTKSGLWEDDLAIWMYTSLYLWYLIGRWEYDEYKILSNN